MRNKRQGNIPANHFTIAISAADRPRFNKLKGELGMKTNMEVMTYLLDKMEYITKPWTTENAARLHTSDDVSILHDPTTAE